MTTNGWKLVSTDFFLEQVALIQEYIAPFSEKRTRQLTSDLMNFAADRIPLNPYTFIEYYVMKTPNGSYRKAIFKHNYAIIYKIETESITFLDVYHTSRNKGNIEPND